MNSRKTDTFLWGGLQIPINCGPEGWIVIGSPGSGKSTLLHLMYKSILPTIKEGTNRRCILYDAKRELFPSLLGMGIPEDRIIILNPFDCRCARWDMAADIRAPATAVEVGTLLVPHKSGEIQPFFPEAARSLIAGIMEVFLQTSPGQWTLRDVVLALRTYDRMKCVLSQTPSTNHLVGKFLSGTDTSRDIAATIENTMRRLAFIAAAWERTSRSISLEQWIRDESILLLGSSPTLESTLVQLNMAILHRASQIMLDQPEARFQPVEPQNWIFIDELRRAGRLEHLPGFIVEGRSKGVCFVAAFQDLPGLAEVYGDKLARELIGTPRNQAALQIFETDTQKFASDLFGKQEVEITRYGFNWGKSASFSTKDSTTSNQSGSSVSRTIHSRPVVDPLHFKMLPSPNRKNGIHGFFYASSIGAPYRGFLSGEYVEENCVHPHPLEPAVLLRPPEHQYLRDWHPPDLVRLGFGNRPELLDAGKARNAGSKGKHKKSNRKDDDDPECGLLPLMPKR